MTIKCLMAIAADCREATETLPAPMAKHPEYSAKLAVQPGIQFLCTGADRSLRLYSGLPELDYPFHDRTITVTRCGRICMGPLKINLSQAFASQKVGVKQVEEKIWLVSFMRYDLGFFDHETCRIESAENPFAAKLLPMSPV
jgi:hypothetical protein